MSHSYAGSSASYPANFTLLDDLVDPRNAASVNTPLQSAADRTAWIASQLGGVLTRGASVGVQLVRHVANTTLLTALTDLTNGELAIVDALGVFQYNSTATATVDNITVVSSSTGRWLSLGVGLSGIGGAKGVPQLDANAKVALANVHNAPLEINAAEDTASTFNGSTWNTTVDTATSAAADSSKYKVTLATTLQAGDTVEVEGRIFYTFSASSNTFTLQCLLQDGSSSINLPGCYLNTGVSIVAGEHTLSARYIVVTGGAGATVKMQLFKSSSAGTGTINTCSSLRVRVTRP